MGIDVLDNPVTNNSANPQIGNRMENDSGEEGWASKISSYLSGIPAAIGAGAKGIGKYAADTVFEKANNVPYSVRAAIAGSRKAEDKLKTLRQFYPDAMPTPDGDFTFTDPKTKQRMSLNDKGWSLGDAIESLPEIGEYLGGTIGTIGGATLGSGAAPGAGTIAGGIGGAGIGSGIGSEAGRQLASKMASILSGKEGIDTRTGGDVAKDFGSTALLNSAFAAVPFGARYLKNRNSAKLLTPESAKQYQYLAEKGYQPTLGQIGSEEGKQLADSRIAGGMIGKELDNQKVLQKNIDNLAGGDLAPLDENQLANQFRAAQQGNVQDLKQGASALYDQFQFGNDIIPADNTRGIIEDIFRKRGLVMDKNGKYVLPKGDSPNPDLVLDSSMERKMNRIMAGQASEAELDSFRSDISTLLRDKTLKYDTKGALIDLKSSLTDDLVRGSPELSEVERAARSAYFDYKDTQKKVKDLIGRSEGVTDKTSIGQGLTEAEALGNAKGIFSSATSGSDAEAKALSDIISDKEKRLILASILKEKNLAKGTTNPLENIQQKYNAERIAQYLSNPADQGSLDDLIKQGQGTKFLPDGSIDKTRHVYGEAAATLGASAINPGWGITAAATGNILRGAPGTFGGSGQFGRSLVTQSAFPQIGRQAKEALALRAARQGEVPGNLNPMPRSNLSLPAAMGVGQMVAGNVADSPESNLRIPDNVINQNLPKGSSAINDLPQLSLDDLMKPQGQGNRANSDLPQFSLDDLMPSKSNPTEKKPIREMQPSVDLPKTNEMGQQLPIREMQPQAAPTVKDLDSYIAKTYGTEEASTKAPTLADLDNYIEKSYGGGGGKTGNRDYSYQNKAAEDYKSNRAGRDVFKEALKRNYGLLKQSGITGDRLDHFVSQLAHESGGFNHLEEIDPSKSNLSDKGGETYKGRGWIQLTGNQNYKKYGDKIGLNLINNPDLASDPDNAMKVAIAYWNDNNLNDLADRNDIKGITRRINGGLNGFEDRKSWLNKVRSPGFEL